MKILDVTSRCVEDAGLQCPAMSEIPGSLIPAWAKGRAEHALTPGRLTPARYRFVAAVADNVDYATPNMVPCLQISPVGWQKAIITAIHGRPIVCTEILLHRGKNVHLIPRHSPRTCKIPPEWARLLVQSTASLQRFADGSDAGTSLAPVLIRVLALGPVP